TALMRWSTAAAALRTESFIGLITVVIAVSSAPVFQNVGAAAEYPYERQAVATFYSALIFSSLMLFFSRVSFEALCPPLIKSFTTLDSYLDRLPPASSEAILIRDRMLNDWNESNDSKRHRWITTTLVWLFFISFVSAFLLAIVALALFGAR
ncbi:MAG TPA: hypothetical protein VMG08_20445, partial [Allosphingosinicella sp.]|nr:hypothetical protein [Allosphingosinicella sp.]